LIATVEFILIQFCGKFFAAEPLSLKEWLFSVGIGLMCAPYGMIMRAIPIPLFKWVVNAVSSKKSKVGK